MKNYTVVNPVIYGKFKNTYEAATSLEAASGFWKELTGNNYITNNVPHFLFTLQDDKDKSLHHFSVKEKAAAEGSKYSDYSIAEVTVKLSKKEEDEFIKEANSVKSRLSSGEIQAGGKRSLSRKRYADDDSSSSSDDDIDIVDYIRIRNLTHPISYWWYAPTIYNVRTVFTPTFVSPLYPYVQTWFPPTLVPTR